METPTEVPMKVYVTVDTKLTQVEVVDTSQNDPESRTYYGTIVEYQKDEDIKLLIRGHDAGQDSSYKTLKFEDTDSFINRISGGLVYNRKND